MREDLWRAVRAFALLSGAGFYFVVILGIFIFAGMKFDEVFVAHPYGKLIGILLGFPVGIYSLYRQIKALS